MSMDTNDDGELQLQEVTGLLAGMGNMSTETMQEMFQDEDADLSSGLNAFEFQEALDRWGAHCSAMRRSWFCSGGSMIRCCRRGLFWKKCGSTWHHHNCWGGHSGGWAGHGRVGWMQTGAEAPSPSEELAAPEATSGAKRDEAFMSMDTNDDGELQLQEVTGLLAGMGNMSTETMQEMFQDEDADLSSGLNAFEFQEALDRWGAHCSAMRRSWFCSGGSMIRCCRRGLFWKKCGSTWHHHNCWGGHSGGWAGHGRVGWMQTGAEA